MRRGLFTQREIKKTIEEGSLKFHERQLDGSKVELFNRLDLVSEIITKLYLRKHDFCECGSFVNNM